MTGDVLTGRRTRQGASVNSKLVWWSGEPAPPALVCSYVGHVRGTGSGRCTRCGHHRDPMRISG